MHLSSDEVVFWQHGFVKLNLTIVMTWVLMVVLAGGSHLITLDEEWQRTLSRIKWPTKMLPQVLGEGKPTVFALIREYLFVSLLRHAPSL